MLLKLMLFLHIFSSIMLVGGIFARQLVRTYAKKLLDVNAIPDHFLLHSASKKIRADPGRCALNRGDHASVEGAPP